MTPAMVEHKEVARKETSVDKEAIDDILKTRLESLDMSQRTVNALMNANIRTLGGLARKKERDLLDAHDRLQRIHDFGLQIGKIELHHHGMRESS